MKYKTDFLIIGSGISGLSFALYLSKLVPKANLFLATKQNLLDSSTYYAQGGIACVWNDGDNFEKHIQDTLIAGDGLCKENVVRHIIQQAPDRINDLIDLGVNFNQNNDGEYELGKEGGHSVRRIFHVNDQTGKSVEEILIDHVKKLDNIQIKENWCAVNLYVKNLKCHGAYILEEKSEEIHNISAKATILATGGAGKIYLYTTNPDIISGDGIAMAYRAGAMISNLEFYQFHPTCLYHPYAKSFLITEAMRGEGAILKDIRGNEFMKKYHPQKDLAPRDIVSRAIDAELKKSGLDFNIDITKEPIPIVPAAHYCCGGVVAEINGKTDIKNLFVIGETACTGFHGSNRLASNSLLEGLVGAYECASYLSQYISQAKITEFPEWESGNAVPSSEAVVITQNWDEIRMLMQNLVGIVRSDSRLKRALKRMIIFAEEIDYYYWNYKVEKNLVELRNLSMVAELLIRCALSRKESRGTHFNENHPYKLELARNSYIKRPW
ncbi:MAG: L-aspartate oxidase [Candidatus Hermodarchaeota archaeon]